MKIEKAYNEKQVLSIVIKTIILVSVVYCGIICFIIKNQPIKKEMYNESLVSLELEEPDFNKVESDAEYAFMMYTEADYQWTKSLDANELILKKQGLQNVNTVLEYHSAILEKMPRNGNEYLINELEEIDKIYVEYQKTLEEDIKSLEESQEKIKKLEEELFKN